MYMVVFLKQSEASLWRSQSLVMPDKIKFLNEPKQLTELIIYPFSPRGEWGH